MSSFLEKFSTGMREPLVPNAALRCDAIFTAPKMLEACEKPAYSVMHEPLVPDMGGLPLLGGLPQFPGLSDMELLLSPAPDEQYGAHKGSEGRRLIAEDPMEGEREPLRTIFDHTHCTILNTQAPNTARYARNTH